MSAAQAASPRSKRIDEVRQAWKDANVTPLWETAAHSPGGATPKAYLWKWRTLRPLLDDAIAVASMQDAERRVLALTNPDAIGGRNTTTNLNGCLQVLMPGESARPHRHTPNALRFVLEGDGATTLVDGKPCPMSEGDLIITPGMSWHEHVHTGTAPIVWFDALDVPLHNILARRFSRPVRRPMFPNLWTMPRSPCPISSPSSPIHRPPIHRFFVIPGRPRSRRCARPRYRGMGRVESATSIQ
jgi:gentisate 1,2-dioxygenase